MKHQKIYPRKSEVQPQSKEPLYAELLRAAKVATEDAASVADVLRACLNKVCDCTQWPFAHARILTDENELGGRSAKEVWRVPFLDPRRFRDRALRMNRLRSGIDWRMQMVTTARPTVLFDLLGPAHIHRGFCGTQRNPHRSRASGSFRSCAPGSGNHHL